MAAFAGTGIHFSSLPATGANASWGNTTAASADGRDGPTRWSKAPYPLPATPVRSHTAPMSAQPHLDAAAGEPPAAHPSSDHPPASDAFGIPPLVAALRAGFNSGHSRPYSWRIQQLDALKRMVEQGQESISAALYADVGKPALEAYITEIGFILNSIQHTKSSLQQWMSPKRVPSPFVTQPATSRIHQDPLGVVLIIAPWNYPFQLAIAPLIGAIAAGNCALVKPSEVAPATSAVIKRLIGEHLDGRCIQVVEGGIPETTSLLAQRFDHIFYTGNGHVGRIVMAAAAKHLTPVTLELGGKSPCYIDRDADIDVTVKRIAWGKWTNAGQTCVAPDYLLVHHHVYEAVVRQLGETIMQFWGKNPQQSKDYGRIVNARHHARLMKLLDDAKSSGAKVAIGGNADVSDRYLAPTLLTDVSADSAIMQNEIFGPLLPILKVDNSDHAIRFINARPKPLALYIFSESASIQDSIVQRTSSGGVAVNHTVLHLLVPDLPFGGVGDSGMGAYHGKAGFDTFTHQKSVFSKPTLIDPPLIYPPYSSFKGALLRTLL